jgi:hypothetical protein
VWFSSTGDSQDLTGMNVNESQTVKCCFPMGLCSRISGTNDQVPTKSMEENTSQEANIHSANEEISHLLLN